VSQEGRKDVIAVPAKGRLREPSVSLLGDAGLGPEEPGERALAFPCRNAALDVLLVRAADVPEYVQDGAVDCGITGADLVRERGADVVELLQLGFGACTLEAAVPEGHRGLDSKASRDIPARSHREVFCGCLPTRGERKETTLSPETTTAITSSDRPDGRRSAATREF